LLSREAANTSIIDLDLPQLGLEPTTYSTPQHHWYNRLRFTPARTRTHDLQHSTTSLMVFKATIVFVNFHFFYRQHIHHITCTEQDKHIISVNDSYCYLCAQHITTFFLKSIWRDQIQSLRISWQTMRIGGWNYCNLALLLLFYTLSRNKLYKLFVTIFDHCKFNF
jgi:hypothetical protein